MRGGQSDHLYWFTPSVSAPVRVKDIYSELIIIKVPGTAPMFRKALWKTGCPPRMIFFAWLLFNNRNLTWENLRKRCWHGPSWCSMCESDEETNLHMFFQCISTQEIWYELAFLYDFPHVVFDSVHAAFQWWISQCETFAPSSSSWYGLSGSGGTTKFSMIPGSLSNLSCPVSAPITITLQATGYSFIYLLQAFLIMTFLLSMYLYVSSYGVVHILICLSMLSLSFLRLSVQQRCLWQLFCNQFWLLYWLNIKYLTFSSGKKQSNLSI